MDGPKDMVEGPDGVIGLAQETTSYYGKLNWLCYNVSSQRSTSRIRGQAHCQVGYHNEHHDFPSVPWTRLPELRRVAWGFYAPLPSHASWPYVTWKFITDPNVGMWNRAKRTDKGEKIDPSVWATSVSPRFADELAEELLDREMTERGYGSDREDSKRG
jgi:sphingolipid delta-4 desaturase